MSNQNESMSTPATATPAAAPLSFTVSATVLRAAIKATAPAMSSDELRPVLNGVLFELRAATSAAAIRDGSAPHVLSLVGCDGRRLHVAQIPIDGLSLPPSPARSLAFIMPASAVRALLKTCFPAKVKNGAALLTVSRRAAAIVNSTPVNWLCVNTEAGEFTCPEAGGNYPNFRQVIPPAPSPSRPSVFIKFQCAANVAEIEDAENLRFTESCLSAAALSAAQAGLPFPSAQILRAALPSVRKLIKDARAKDPCAYFEQGPAGRLIPLALNFGPVPPSMQFNADGTKVFFMGAKDVRLSHPSGTSGGLNAPAVAVVGINPKYLADLTDSCAAFNDVPGSPLDGALIAPDTSSPFVLKSNAAIDSGTSFAFVAVIMPQRTGK